MADPTEADWAKLNQQMDGLTMLNEAIALLGPDAGDPEDEDEFDNPWIGD